MAPMRNFLKNAITQLFDEIEDKCHVKFATFTASETQGQKNLQAGEQEYMQDRENNMSNGVYKYLYDPELNFDFRFHQRLAMAPVRKTSTPWVTIMFNTKQVRPLTSVLSHVYRDYKYHEGVPYEVTIRRVSVPVNMVLISNSIDKLYNTTEKIAMYFDRFINFHYDQVVTIGDPENGGFQVAESKVGQAAGIREVDLNKLDTQNRGGIVSQAYQFDLIYWIYQTPETSLHLLKKIIIELDLEGQREVLLVLNENGEDITNEPEENPQEP